VLLGYLPFAALESAACAFPSAFDPLADAFPCALDSGPGTLAEALDTLSCALPKLLHAAADAGAHGPDAFPGSLADLLDRPPDAARQVADDLRVVVDRLDEADDDGFDGVEADLDQRVDLDVVDDQADVAEGGVGAHVQLQQVEDLGVQANVGFEVIEGELDAPDVGVRVDEDVGP
jgi:hypothetical protein